MALTRDGPAQAVARILGVDPGEQRRREVELLRRRGRRVEHERDAPLARSGGDVELVGDDRREREQGDDDAGVAHGERARGVVRGVLGQQFAGQRGERHPHPDAGRRLRERTSTSARAGSQASARTPAPISAQPTAARTRASPRTRVPTTAPSGDDATVAAAASGDYVPARDEQQDEQEEDRAERGRHEREGERRAHENVGGDPGRLARAPGPAR